ncbi:hypothetical protein [Nonlabens antarcticus]|uniref:hypothetical protein n=1 Tax=Nonlabens antarcticus TaxID=392714 RepID=UPI001890F2C3|nr:hypothetical protein [Nonlabens antarcticus]
MKWFLRFWSYISSPLLIPLLVSVWFLSYSEGIGNPNVPLKLYIIGITTTAIPLVIYTVLKILKLADSVHLSSTKERLIPLVIYAILIIILLRGVFQDSIYGPLYYFFIGLLMSTIVALVLAIFQFKISLHMMGIAGALGFVIAISLLIGIPLLYSIIGLSVATGLTASSRLSMKAHTVAELVCGTIAGLLIQISLAAYYIL